MTGSKLVIPSKRELESLSPTDRWDLEDSLEGAQGILQKFNDDELRRWVEVEYRTQAEIAEMVGRSQSRVQQRCARLGLVSSSRRGRPRITSTGNSHDTNNPDEEEYVEGEVVEPQKRRPNTPRVPAGAAHVLSDRSAADALENPRTQLVELYTRGRRVRSLLDGGKKIAFRSDEDREALLQDAQLTIQLLQRVRRRLK